MQTNEQQAVDVLAVMFNDGNDADEQRRRRGDTPKERAAAEGQSLKAQAAVAELIAAATEVRKSLAIILDTESEDDDQYERLGYELLPRLRAAIATCGGAK